jgi:ubiquinone/menaquinone biosynthesis C-methylase UbiE
VNDPFREFEIAGWREPGRAEAYDAVVGRVTARAAEPLLDAAGVHAGTSVIDVATGTGHVAGAAAARGALATGVDVSKEMLARARRVYDDIAFALGDAERLAYDDDTFDAAVAAFLLHHVPSPERVVAELARVARRVAVAQWDAPGRARLIGLITDAIAAAGSQAAGRPAHRPFA